MAVRRRGVFCLEEADCGLKTNERSTVAYVLEFLRQPPADVPFVRGDIGTVEELG